MIKLVLKHKDNLAVLGSVKDIRTECSLSVGAVVLLHQVSERLGIAKALGSSREGKLVLWQVMSRLIAQGSSRMSAVRLASSHAALEVLGLKSFH